MTQWTDYMEQILDIITINRESDNNSSDTPVHMDQQHFPYRISDADLPTCNTGFVYMILSLKDMSFIYIGEIVNITVRLQQHNSGYGSISTAPSHLGPYAMIGYVCGFGNRKTLRQSVEARWKFRRDQLIRNGIHDIRQLCHCVQDVLPQVDENRFQIDRSDLIFVSLLK